MTPEEWLIVDFARDLKARGLRGFRVELHEDGLLVISRKPDAWHALGIDTYEGRHVRYKQRQKLGCGHEALGLTVRVDGTSLAPLPMRFWFSVSRGSPDACWEWGAVRTRDGYGRITASGPKYSAHRISYELAHGPIPDGLLVMHRCDNPPCVNPRHLFIGTNADNMADQYRKGRHAWGERNGRALVTEAIVRKIRKAHANGAPRAQLAAKYGLKKSSLDDIIYRKTWKHVD